MVHPQIRILGESVQSSARQAITGIVFLDFGDFQFPESTWNDHVAVVLGWWLSALIELLSGSARQVELRFMDGPLWVEAEQVSGRCLLRCMTGRPGCLEYEGEAPLLDLTRSALSAATQLRRICRDRGWHSRDIETLEERINSADVLTGRH